MKWPNHLALPIIVVHTLVYYFWIYFWREDSWAINFGGNIICLVGVIIALIFMLITIVRNKGKEKYFWLLLTLQNFSYLISEIIWTYYMVILKLPVPAPSWTDIFSYMRALLVIIAIGYLIYQKKRVFNVAKFLFNSIIVMSVLTTIVWNYIIDPLVSKSGSKPVLAIIALIGYPIGDLVILFGVISIFMSSVSLLSKKTMQLLSLGLIINSIADFWYAFTSLTGTYVFGSWVDPLWTLSAMILAYSGHIYSTQNKYSLDLETSLHYQTTDKIRFLLPYISIIFLMVIIIVTNLTFNDLLIGFVITILLMIVCQVFTIFENHLLLRQFYILNRSLEDKVTERTRELADSNTKLSYRLYHDLLTGLPNRASMNELILNLISTHQKFALLFLDLDNFKHVNDSLGHSMGDILLKKIAHQLQSVVKSNDSVTRLGGDEFMIIIKEINDKIIVEDIALQIIDSFRTSIELNDYNLIVSTSIGIALYPDNGEDMETLVKNSDIAMYEAKKQGRNRYYFSETIDDNGLIDDLKILNYLHIALEKDEFCFYIQPKFDITTLKITRGEILIRWNHPEMGIVLPGTFISLAEETGLIIPIGEWIIRNSFEKIKSWSNIYDLGTMRFSINISPLQFLQNNLIPFIKDCLSETKLEAKYIEFEITENIALQNSEKILSKLQEIRELGFEISIDDFGTGYSSMNYLSKYPINTLKIDISFVREITENEENAAIVTAIIAMAHSLNLKVIAEGIETKEQLKILCEKRCDFGQGYLIGKPMVSSNFEEKFIKYIKS